MTQSTQSKPQSVYACLYAREFPAQAMLRLRPELREKPCAVIEGEAPLQSVCSLNTKARVLGIARGMTRVEMDLFPSVTVLPRARGEEAGAKAALLECAGSFSPRVEERSQGNAFVCVMDIAGTEKLFGPPATLAIHLRKRAKTLGIVASVAVSSNVHAAICVACGKIFRNQVTVIPNGEESAALASLPLTVLDLSAQHRETFALWGIRSLGMLAALPEKDLIARLGQEGQRLLQLARGEFVQLFVPVETAFLLEERMELDTPVEALDSLLFVLGVMLEQLIVRAATRVLALASVTIALSLEGGAAHTRTVRPALPANDRQMWIRLLHLDLEAHPPPAAILSLTLAAEPGIPSKVQLGLFSPQHPEPLQLDITLARIRAIVGEECAGRAVLKDTHEPDAFRMEPFTVSSQPVSAPTTKRAPSHSLAAMRQLRPRENVAVTFRSEQPTDFVFRRKRYAVEHAYGPWLTSGDWWNPMLWGFEQWDLIARTDDGGELCCCLVRDLVQNFWQMLAFYD